MLGLLTKSAVRSSSRLCCRPCIQRRHYAFSRLPQREIGSRRTRPRLLASSRPVQPVEEKQHDGSDLWEESIQRFSEDPKASLQNLLMGNDTLIIERKLEMLNVFVGFEQCNRYSISNLEGEVVGYITEEQGSFFSSFGRQLYGTHRPFRALVMDTAGAPLLWLRRPFSFINSRMYVQRLKDYDQYTADGEPVLDTFAEVQQIWHPWRRKYDLFLRSASDRRVLSLAEEEEQPTPEPLTFSQFARVDAPFLAWDFALQDEYGNQLSFITKNFVGIGREIFTDTSKYAVRFGADLGPILLDPEEQRQTQTLVRHLTLDQRALTLALAVNIDFDYFSRHSGHGGGFFHIGGFGE